MMMALFRLKLICSLLALLLCSMVSAAVAAPKPGTQKWCAQRIFSRQDPEIEKALQGMTLPEKIGQMIIAQIEPQNITPQKKEYLLLSRLVKEGKVGGIMFLKGDVVTAGALVNHFQSIAPRPLLISSDMERGVAMRLNGATEFPPNMALAATRDPDLAEEMADAIAEEAKMIGIYQNYAPTVDLNSNPQNPVINTRSFGDSLPTVISMSNAIIKGLQSNGIIATAKHFPGHGDVVVDSHLELPVLEANRRQLDAYELIPFRAAIEHGVISVMVGHIAVPKVTGNKEPASISKIIVTDLLRKELGFQGLIITDALNMKALHNGHNEAEIAVKAVLAGNDLLLFPPDPERAHSAIVKAVEKGVIPMDQIDASVRRILQAKAWLELQDRRVVDSKSLKHHSSPPSHRRLAKRITSRAITLLNDTNHKLPLKTEAPADSILNIIVQDKVNNEMGKEYIRQLDQSYAVHHIRINAKTDSLGYAKALELASKAKAVIITSYSQKAAISSNVKLSVQQQNFIHRLAGVVPKNSAVILVAFGTPYISNYFPGITTTLCAYSATEDSEGYVVELLRGKFKPRGVLPVSLHGTSR